MLSTWLVKDGYGLTAQPAKVKLDAYSLDVYGDSAYIIDTGLTSADVVNFGTAVGAQRVECNACGCVWLFGGVCGDARVEEELKCAQVR